MKITVIIAVLISLSTSVLSQNVRFRLSGIESYMGVIRVAVYQNEKDYSKETTNLKYTFDKSKLALGLMEVQLELSPGKYVFAFLDDTNKDAKMNYNLVGIPKEGYAFSRIENYGYSRPKYYEAILEVKDGENNFTVQFNYF